MILLPRTSPLSILILIVSLLSVVISDTAYARTDPKKLFDKGVACLEKNDLKKAEGYFKKVTKISFGNYPSYFNLSLLSLTQKDYPKSLKYLKEAKKLNPFDMRADKMLSIAHFMSQNNEESKKYLLQIISKNPSDIDAHKKLGIIYLKENSIESAIAEFTLIKNLSPSDLDGNLLLGISSALNNDFAKALEKIKKFKEQLTEKEQLAFYALMLEKNNLQEDASAIFDKIQIQDKKRIIENQIASLGEKIILNEIKGITLTKEYENPEVTKRIAEKLKKEEALASTAVTSKPKGKRPFGLKGTLTETFELYDRTPKTSNPINALNVTSNLKLEGKTSNGIDFSGEWEGFFNRWDNNKLDFYKINTTKRNEFEVDIGKFSAKHFPTLVSYPTVLEGIRVWKKTTPPDFKSSEIPIIEENLQTPVNLGEMYREHYVDNRSFKNIEMTVLSGRTLESKDVNDRKEENERSYESSGQFEQWTQSYRVHSQINKIFELGTSLSITQDTSRDTTIVSSTTYPIESVATGIDGGIDLLDNDLNIDAEIAFGNYDSNTLNVSNKHARDPAWIFESEYKAFDTNTFSYEQKYIGKNFKVEGASQTQDKLSHTFDWEYKPQKPKTWSIQSQTLQFKPEKVSPRGHGDTKKIYRTIQSVTDVKLPQDAKYIVDCKYYYEWDKCECTEYKTLTFKYSLEWPIQGLNTTIKPSYSFERKNDLIAAPTDEKKKEYIFTIENTSIKNLELDYSWEREKKTYHGATTKSYRQYINTFEAKYIFIPSRFDMTFKASQDFKNPSDTNKTDIDTLTYELNYTSKDGDDKFKIKYERKHNTYLPWSETSAYRQNYTKLEYTKKF